MSTESKSSNPTKTVLVITVGFLVLFLISKQDLFLYIAIGVGILGAISSYLAGIIDWIWIKIGWVLSFIVPNIIMTIVFYIILTPTAFLSRIFGKKDAMDLRNTSETLWKQKGATYTKESFEKPW